MSPTSNEESAGQEPRAAAYICFVSVAVVSLAVLVQSVTYVINPDETGLLARFGRLEQTVGPGLHFKLPFGIEYVERVATSRIFVEEFGYRKEGGGDTNSQNDERGLITRDLSMVEVRYALHYRVTDAIDYVATARDPVATLRMITRGALSRIVGRYDSATLLAGAGTTISAALERRVQRDIDEHSLGITVFSVDVREISPPESVKDALVDVNLARQEKERLVNEARLDERKAIPEAKGRGSRVVADAEREAIGIVSNAESDIAAFEVAYEHHRENPSLVRDILYIDTLRSVLPGAGKVLVVQNGQSAPLSFLDLGER